VTLATAQQTIATTKAGEAAASAVAAASSAATFTEPLAVMATSLINTQSIVVAHHAFA
jgi:hypothetical protein